MIRSRTRARGAYVAAALLAAVPATSGSAWAVADSPAAREALAACETREGVEHVDWTGMWFDHDVVCDNAPGDVRLQSFTDSPVVGRMITTRSWFVCWKTGDPHAGGNSIWYYTQGDEIVSRPATRAWGYMPAHMVHSGSHPAPGLPKCSWG